MTQQKITLRKVQCFAEGTVLVEEGVYTAPEALPRRVVKTGADTWQERGGCSRTHDEKGRPILLTDQEIFERFIEDDFTTPGSCLVYASEAETPRGEYRR